MILVFTGEPFLAREALLQEARLQGLPLRLVPPDAALVAQEVQGGLFGPGGALVDLRELAEADWKPLREVLEALPKGAVVLLLDPKPSASRGRWYAERAQRRDHPVPGPRELAQWVANRARHHGLRLSGAVASYLAGLVGGRENPMGLEALDQELRKLTLATPPLTLEKVQALVALDPPLSGFELVRATAEGRLTQALRLGRDLLERGEDPLRILAALSWQYVQVAKAWALLRDEPFLGEGALAKALGLHPLAAKQALSLAKGMSGEAVGRALEILLEAELAAKTGKDPRLALERAVVGLCSP
ncbi:MAG: DNA polymerase III subunit delta [Meiothermus sp.]|uniref:DNA polymerase III subunit delta n=1 Tax=Meiothermus sp. TaxID=1955249 RepID=UPI0025CDB68F|nr:DNA polymerase III subunit delta [Meiothermus sp.]MCS7058950.1 DNA polymerase III subunit delta [Meiothermus sp.]MCS7194674.1 DNA polymerase III subunit delta [Meiothermus sp.]MCX7739633.1 DNA polymerase III subunit delta [Meiothermus sp.]MDW8090515.1 DNA polymerase III subunit delta [Meiothermus sp.]MDW8482165.1 DNA polymerase III subunit delta [Meiothermus sp.]